MSKRRQPQDSSARPGPGGQESGAPTPDAGGGASSFDVAADLLQAALDEVRVATASGRSTPKAPPAARPAAPPVTPAPAARSEWAPRPAEPEQPDPWAPRPPSLTSPPGGTKAPTTRSKGRKGATPTDPADAVDAVDAPFARPTPSRRRAGRPPVPAPTPAAGDTSGEFDGLTDSLYEAPERGSRRRRRPAAAGGAAAAAVAGRGPDLPPTPPDDVALHATDATAVLPRSGAVPVEAAVEPSAEAPGVGPSTPGEVGAVGDDDRRRPKVPAAVAAAPSEPSIAPDPYGLTSDPSRRRTRVVAALAVAAVVVAGLAFVLLSGGGSDDPALQTTPGARFTFDTVTNADGAEITRIWELKGTDGDQFIGRLEITNPRATAMRTTVVETIPKSIAASVDDIRFDPEPVVLQADPVVQYTVSLPARGTMTARYEVDVAAKGAERSRLEAWARELPLPTTTTTTRPAPATTFPTTGTTTGPTTGPTTGRTTGRTTGPTPGPGPGPAPGPTPAPPQTTGTTTAPAPPPPTSPPEPPPTSPPEPPAATGTMVMRVYSRGGTGSFTLSGSGGAIPLTTTGSPNGFAQVGFTVDTGVYTWTLAGADGWTFVGLACEDRKGPADTTVSGATASMNVGPGETVVCSWTVKQQ